MNGRDNKGSLWINPGDGSAIPGKDKIKGVKPLMASMVCSFFGASMPESITDSIISLITIEVRNAGILIPEGTLQMCSCQYSSQSFLDPTEMALWLVPTWVLGGHRLVFMQSLFRVTSLSI